MLRVAAQGSGSAPPALFRNYVGATRTTFDALALAAEAAHCVAKVAASALQIVISRKSAGWSARAPRNSWSARAPRITTCRTGESP